MNSSKITSWQQGKLTLHYFLAIFILLTTLAPVRQSAAQEKAETADVMATYQELPSDSFMTRWLVLGPLPVFAEEPDPEDQETQKAAFAARELSPASLGSVKNGQSVTLSGEQYQWKLVQSSGNTVDLTEVFGEKEFAIAYAWAEIQLPEARRVLLGLGSDDGVKVWLNGELVHENWIGRAVHEDDDLVPLALKKGRNYLLLKVQNMQQAWGFSCRPLGKNLFPQKLVFYGERGNIDALKLLLDNGADINARGKIGLTALQAAQIQGRTETMNFLKERGADSQLSMPSASELTTNYFQLRVEGEEPGAAVLVAKDGKILYQNGFGYASLAHDVPITPDTKFRIGSVTKQFTAAAILKLQEAGLLSVSDSLSKFIPDYPRGGEVTLYHLLTHTSGIHSYTSKPDFLETATVEITPEKLIESFKNDEFDFDPGEQWLYNNSGYFLLGYIVAEVSGKSYREYLQETFFSPLGMTNTGVYDAHAVLENEATGYAYIDGHIQKALDWNMSRAGGAGALYATVGDLFRWNEAVFSRKVISEASLEAALTPVKLNDGSKPAVFGSGGYGFGWGISTFRGLPEYSHGGGLHGFVSHLSRFPEQNMSVAVLSNCAPAKEINPGEAAHQVAAFYLWEEMEAQESFAKDESIDPDIYDAYVGRYEYPRGAIMTITRDGDRLFAQLSGQPKFEIFPRSETEFFWKVVDAQISFVRNDSGTVTGAIHRQGGQEISAPRLEPEQIADVDPAIYASYAGEYELAPESIVNVITEEDRLFLQWPQQPKFEIFPRSETEFFLKVVKAEVIFQKNEAGEVTGLTVLQGGMKQSATKIK